MKTLVLFILLLGVLIFVHELGHFLVARALGIRVLRFSLGFGPILRRWGRGETEYAISAIPLGGYVKLYGEETAEEGEEIDVKHSFSHRPVHHRALVILAGPVMNILLAFLLFTAIALPGEPYGLPVVSRVSEDFPAAAAGLREGDRITAIDGAPVASWDEMSRAIKESGGRELELTLEREGRSLTVRVNPVSREEEEGEKRYVIGIQGPAEFARRPIPLWRAPIEGAVVTWEVVALTGDAVWRLLTGRGSREELMGPIGIAVETGEAAKRGAIYLFTLLAGLSVNLGVLNLLPIPVLDGGHLLFLGYEAVRGRPLSRRVREIALQIGFLFLLGLMGFVILNDIFRVVSR